MITIPTKVNFMAQNAIMNVISRASPATTDFTSNARDPSTGFLPLEAGLWCWRCPRLLRRSAPQSRADPRKPQKLLPFGWWVAMIWTIFLGSRCTSVESLNFSQGFSLGNPGILVWRNYYSNYCEASTIWPVGERELLYVWERNSRLKPERWNGGLWMWEVIRPSKKQGFLFCGDDGATACEPKTGTAMRVGWAFSNLRDIRHECLPLWYLSQSWVHRKYPTGPLSIVSKFVPHEGALSTTRTTLSRQTRFDTNLRTSLPQVECLDSAFQLLHEDLYYSW